MSESYQVPSNAEGKSEALRTFIEQTKLLVSLSSGFVLAPPAVLSFFRRPDNTLVIIPWWRFFCAEGFLIASILAGYMVLGTIAGSQYCGDFNVHRRATRVTSIFQLLFYIAGIVSFLFIIKAVL